MWLRPQEHAGTGAPDEPRGKRRRILHLVAQGEVGEQEADAVVALTGQRPGFRILGLGKVSAEERATLATIAAQLKAKG